VLPVRPKGKNVLNFSSCEPVQTYLMMQRLSHPPFHHPLPLRQAAYMAREGRMVMMRGWLRIFSKVSSVVNVYRKSSSKMRFENIYLRRCQSLRSANMLVSTRMSVCESAGGGEDVDKFNCTQINACVYENIHTNVYNSAYTYKYMYTYMCTYMYMHMYVYIHIHIYIYICTRKCIHMTIYTCMYTCIYSCIYTHIY